MKISKEVKIGGFAIAMLLGLIWALNFVKGEDLLSTNNKYFAYYSEVGGLQPSSPIFIKGIKVGNVSSITYNPAESKDVVLQLNIAGKYKIPSNSIARIFNNGLMGGKAIQIELGDATTYLKDGTKLDTEVDRDFMEVAGSEFEFFKQKANQIANDLETTLLTVNKILIENSVSMNTTMTNMASLTGTVDDVMTSNRDEIRAMISNLHKISATLSSNSQNMTDIMTNVAGFTDSLNRSNLPLLVDNLGKTLGEVNTTLAKVNSGQGSMGKLITDDKLYDSLTMATGNLSRLLEDLKLHPGRYINISVFGGGRNKDK